MLTDTHTLDHAEALQLLRDSHSARIGFSHDGEPFVVPATVTVEPDGRIDIYLDDAHALRHLDGQRVAVEVDGRAPRPGDGWYVVARGVAKSATGRQFVVVPSAVSGHLVRRRTCLVTDGRDGVPRPRRPLLAAR
jgi:Pyridoxamine 5'-phosphate oxidase